MSEIQIHSTITISQETINEIADRIFDRLRVLADSYNESKDKPCDESFELAQETSETEKRTIVKHRRHQSKWLTIDGAKISFQNLYHVFKTFRLSLSEYEKITRPLRYDEHKDDVVQFEAEKMRDILERCGHVLKSYAAYNFDGKVITINF